MDIRSPFAQLSLQRLEEREVALALSLPAALFDQVGSGDSRGAGQSVRLRADAQQKVGGRRGVRRLELDRVPPTVLTVNQRQRALKGELARNNVILGQQPPELLEGPLSEHRVVERVLYRPEGVVGHAERGSEA